MTIPAIAAVDNIGHITKVVGTAYLQRGTQKLSLGADIILRAGDHVMTDKNSITEFRLQEGSLITVGKASDFAITRYGVYKNKPNIALLELVKGAFLSITGSIAARPHRYEVKTATATIGVRGTDFWGGYGLTENGLDVVMLAGHSVYDINAQGEKVELGQAGLGATVINNSSPTTPKKWGEEKVARAVAAITP